MLDKKDFKSNINSNIFGIHYPDLSEVKDTYELESYKPLNNPIPCRYSFATTGPTMYTNVLETYGYIHLRRMRNWWPTHLDEWRVVDLWWRDNGKNTPLYKPEKIKGWGTTIDDAFCKSEMDRYKEEISISGCAFKIFKPQVQKNRILKYFGLMRLPSVTPFQRSQLKRFGFQQIGRSSLAHFFVNGWSLKEYDREVEESFFDSLKLPRNYDKTVKLNMNEDLKC